MLFWLVVTLFLLFLTLKINASLTSPVLNLWWQTFLKLVVKTKMQIGSQKKKIS